MIYSKHCNDTLPGENSLSLDEMYKKYNSKTFPYKYIFTQHTFEKDALCHIKFRLQTNMVSSH